MANTDPKSIKQTIDEMLAKLGTLVDSAPETTEGILTVSTAFSATALTMILDELVTIRVILEREFGEAGVDHGQT